MADLFAFQRVLASSIKNCLRAPPLGVSIVNRRVVVRCMSSKDTQNKSRDETATQTSSEPEQVVDPYLPPWPDGINPHTGEHGGPRGPEPTRYGDWERKGRVTDF